jgi:hypothetical protein
MIISDANEIRAMTMSSVGMGISEIHSIQHSRREFGTDLEGNLKERRKKSEQRSTASRSIRGG